MSCISKIIWKVASIFIDILILLLVFSSDKFFLLKCFTCYCMVQKGSHHSRISVASFTDYLIDHILEQTNLFSVQTTGKSVNTYRKEMKIFIGIQIRMSTVKMTVYRHYWANGNAICSSRGCNENEDFYILMIIPREKMRRTKTTRFLK